jgi:hypothetical protein
MRTIEKKSWPKEFGEIARNRKHFDVRLADFKIKQGDALIFKEWNPKTKKYTGKKLKFKVSLIYKIPQDAHKFYSKKDVKKHGLFVIDLKK